MPDLIDIFGEDFTSVLASLDELPPQVEDMLMGVMDKMVYDVRTFSNSLEKSVYTMTQAGTSPEIIKQTLKNDMGTGGRIFGQLRNDTKASIVDGINQSAKMGQYKNYDLDKGEFVWVAVGGHKVCMDCDGRAGQKMTFAGWEAEGLPGSGWSVCQGFCYCVLDPTGKASKKIDAPVREPGRKKAVAKATGKTTFTDYKTGNKEIKSYFANQEKKNPRNIQFMQKYTSENYHHFNKTGRKWDNEISLGNEMLIRQKTLMGTTRNNKGKLFYLEGVDEWKGAFTELKSFLNKTPDYKGTAHRGLRLETEVDLDKFLLRFKSDSVVESNSFWSSSASREVASDFSGMNPEFFRIHMTIEGKTGTIMDEYVQFVKEQEILFNANTKFRVKSITKKSEIDRMNNVYVVLEEI